MKIGTLELVIILAVVIIIFGPTQIPKLTKMFGKSVKNFKEGLEETEEEAPESEAPKKAKKAKSSSAAPKKDADASDEQE
jgi:sec-independent protein translocase protein TatA